MQKIGKQSLKFENMPVILETACIAGPKEADRSTCKIF